MTWLRARLAYARGDLAWIVAAFARPEMAAWIAAFSAGASAVAALFSYQQVKLAAEVPFRQVTFQSKIQALQDFRRAATAFESDLRITVTSLTFGGYDGNVTDVPLGMISINSTIARPFVDKYHAFVTSSDAAGVLWQQPVRDAIHFAQKNAFENANCFITLASYNQEVPNSREQTAAKALEPCRMLITREPFNNFVKAARDVDQSMRNELEEEIKQTGPVRVPPIDELTRF